MGRALLSQFLILSNSSPRLSSSLSCRGLGTKYLKRSGVIRHNRATNGDNAAGFRCCCSVSLSQPPAPETSSSSVKKRIVSGVQPTGAIHLGNYLGAIKNWIALQNSYDTLFFIVDLHAITLPYDTQQLSKATRNTAAIYLACGVDTSKASVFVQSHVRAHVELMWLLSSATPIGWLNRMIQFKEKSRKAGDENVGVALLTYPVLMASDILLYQSDFVPVGEDQKQHLELTRELAERVNYLYGGRKWKKLGGRGGAIFKVPEPLIPPAGARVMSLTDGLSKMSKSAPSDQSRINLLDPKDAIANKIKRCKTDSFPGMEFDNPERPECNNLLSIYQLISSKTKEEVAQECQDMNWGTFKTLLTDALVEHLHPIQVRYEEIISDPAYLDGVLAEGAEKAAAIADATVNNVYQAMGFLRR
ncbi:Tryptophan-tRNA ligase [Corchorus capsularis]|uniref:tryptophan--tRNA ligase n=1 Tax=Corchorus capsularis TaxID=210143 RepID=A0A1R3JH55_COCAP|nr:Tryptophan-tRNA ligase [Corchorus capsularis]